jgi:hypothetical protein
LNNFYVVFLVEKITMHATGLRCQRFLGSFEESKVERQDKRADIGTQDNQTAKLGEGKGIFVPVL